MSNDGIGKAGLIAFAAAAGGGLWKMFEERLSNNNKLDDIVEHLENIESKLEEAKSEKRNNDKG